MTTFLQNMKDPNSDQHKKMDQVLLGGRGQQKRLYAVDETIYGTNEGSKLQQEAAMVQQREKNKKKGRKKKKKESTGEGAASEELDAENDNMQEISTVKRSVAAVAVAGALAASASLFLSGKRS